MAGGNFSPYSFDIPSGLHGCPTSTRPSRSPSPISLAKAIGSSNFFATKRYLSEDATTSVIGNPFQIQHGLVCRPVRHQAGRSWGSNTVRSSVVGADIVAIRPAWRVI